MIVRPALRAGGRAGNLMTTIGPTLSPRGAAPADRVAVPQTRFPVRSTGLRVPTWRRRDHSRRWWGWEEWSHVQRALVREHADATADIRSSKASWVRSFISVRSIRP